MPNNKTQTISRPTVLSRNSRVSMCEVLKGKWLKSNVTLGHKQIFFPSVYTHYILSVID